MSLLTMTNNILRFCPGIHRDLLKSIIQDSYRQLASRDWMRLRITESFTTLPPSSQGTISINTTGDVTGVGTAFTPGMVGGFLRVKKEDHFFEIATVSSPTSLTILNWIGTTISNSNYQIFKTIYTLNSSFAVIYDLTYQIKLRKKSQHIFNRSDPSRLLTSASPIAWAYAGQSENRIKVELYPVPTAAVSIRVDGKLRPQPLEDDSIPLLPEDLVESFALLRAFLTKATQLPNQGWEQRAEEQKVFYLELLSNYDSEDKELVDHESRVRDAMSETRWPSDDNFALSHDVDW